MKPSSPRIQARWVPAWAIALLFVLSLNASEAKGPLFQKGDRVVFIGNTFAERLALFGYLETYLAGHYAELELSFRNLGWSADTLSLQPRPLNFGDLDTHLAAQKVDVLIACFGMNEAFDGPAGLERFENDWRRFLQRALSSNFNGRTPPRVVMISPITHENLGRPLPDPGEHNRSLELYTRSMESIAAEFGVSFVDLFTSTRKWLNQPAAPRLTFNGIHLTQYGDWVAARLILESLGLPCGGEAELSTEAPVRRRDADASAALLEPEMESLRRKINAKNQQFFYRWRAVNGEYIYGRRAEPFGVASFPPEFEQLDEIIAGLEKEIWARAGGLARRPCLPLSPAGASHR